MGLLTPMRPPHHSEVVCAGSADLVNEVLLKYKCYAVGMWWLDLSDGALTPVRPPSGVVCAGSADLVNEVLLKYKRYAVGMWWLDLSFQAAQHVLSAPVTSALHLLKDTSQNFPSRARSVEALVHLL